ncbi:kinase-like domain-containing protein [Gongronella butleri]|nr:kinase-like domain-containing protein [Gongronella butleri]
MLPFFPFVSRAILSFCFFFFVYTLTRQINLVMGNTVSACKDTNSLVTKADFCFVKILGQGAFGKVYMVKHVGRREDYALKVISKAQCVKTRHTQHILRERLLLERLDHPLVCNLRYAFQDDLFLYMAMDLMLGGDLRARLHLGPCSEAQIQFWMAELACALHYLHGKGVVHRDIKPDNLLIDDEGHLHVTDFNVATTMAASDQRLSSASGTLAYFAPELVRGHTYDEAVDWWCMGMTMYECVYGKRPWREHGGKHALLHQIARGVIQFPMQHECSMHAILLLQSLLEPNPSYRIGYGDDGWLALTQHVFFKDVCWQDANLKKLIPPRPPTRRPLPVDDAASKCIDSVPLGLPISPPRSLANNDDVDDDDDDKTTSATRLLLDHLDARVHGPPKNNDHAEQPSPKRGLWHRALFWHENDDSAYLAGGLAPNDADEQQLMADLSVDASFMQRLQLLQDKFVPFAWTVYDEYEGFLDERRCSVGRPPSWVKPAFDDANSTARPMLPLTIDTTAAMETNASNTHQIATPPITPTAPVFCHNATAAMTPYSPPPQPQPSPSSSWQTSPKMPRETPAIDAPSQPQTPKPKRRSQNTKYFNERRDWERRKSLKMAQCA